MDSGKDAGSYYLGVMSRAHILARTNAEPEKGPLYLAILSKGVCTTRWKPKLGEGTQCCPAGRREVFQKETPQTLGLEPFSRHTSPLIITPEGYSPISYLDPQK